jgi:hypothetical protein
MTPLPEYKKPGHKTLYAQIPDATKEQLDDIAYSLDMNAREAVQAVIEFYHKEKRIKQRPKRARS